eukprot:EG_transcript_17
MRGSRPARRDPSPPGRPVSPRLRTSIEAEVRSLSQPDLIHPLGVPKGPRVGFGEPERKVVYLNPVAHRLKFRPYELRVVPAGEEGPEHFQATSMGMLHVKPGEVPAMIPLKQWQRELMLFRQLTRIKFFKHYLTGKFFLHWRRNAQLKVFLLLRRRLAERLFLSKGTFAPVVRSMQKLTYDLSMTRLLAIPEARVDYTLEKYRDAQGQQRQAAAQELRVTMGKVEAELVRLMEGVVQRAKVPEFTTMDSLEQYLIAQATPQQNPQQMMKQVLQKTMTQKQAEQQTRLRALRRAVLEQELFPDFVRLVDHMMAQNLFCNSIWATREYLHLESLPDEKKPITYQTTICLSAAQEGHLLLPGEEDVLAMYHTLCEDLVQQVNGLTRVAQLGPLKVFPQKPLILKLREAVMADHRFQQWTAATLELFQQDFVRAHKMVHEYELYRDWYIFVEDVWPQEYGRWQAEGADVAHQQFNKYIRSVRAASAELAKMTNRQCGVLMLNTQRLRSELLPQLQAISSTIRAKLLEVSKRKTDKLLVELKERVRDLAARPEDLDGFAAFSARVNAIKAEASRLTAEADEIDMLYRIAEENSMEFPSEDISKKEAVVGGPQAKQASWRSNFLSGLNAAQDYRKANLKAMIETMRRNSEQMVEEVTTAAQQLTTGDCINPTAETREVLAQLAGIEELIRVVKQTSEKYGGYSKLFEVPGGDWSALTSLQKGFKVRNDIWQTLHTWQMKKLQWGSTAITDLDVDQMRTEVNDFYKKAFGLNKEARDRVTELLLDRVGEEKVAMHAIVELGNKHFKKEHWAEIFKAINKPYKPDKPYSLEELRKWKVLDYRSVIEEQSALATGEAALEATLEKIKLVYDDLGIETKGHRDYESTYIIAGVEDVLQTLEDHQVTVQTCLASRYVKNIRPRVEEWDRNLGRCWEVIDEWVTCQKSWMYLEFIFSSDDIKRQLPEESRTFAKIDNDFRNLTTKAHNEKNCLRLCTEEGVLEMLKRDNQLLDFVQKRLEDYLETKRAAFPRFYFLSNDELLAILSDVRNPMNVQPHLQKCFDNIKELQFKKGSLFDIEGMLSGENEAVPFSTPVIAKGNVESWLCEIEARMRTTVLDQLKAAQQAYRPHDRATWFFEFPAQCVVVIDLREWTTDTEAALLQAAGDPNALANWHGAYCKTLESTVALVKRQLTKLQRRCVGTLIVIDVHNRDVIEALVKANCTSLGAFEWNMQLRYYWEEGHVVVRQTAARFVYGYEYLGNSPRLVVTGLTERAYLTCTGALHYNMGAAPQGPAGTGKTESVKDLGKALARQCVVFNCSDGLDYKIMARMFSGLAQAGAWACFDEFNRIGAEVLSVIAQQMLAVTTAIAAKATTLFFEGRNICPNPDFGVFITMNPGYAGRQELPDNLKALFRPVCLMVPDYGLIAEIMFYSEGFSGARILAQKMQQLYRLSSEQLSKQDHYDFGMRAVKSILVMAGSLKRAEPDLPEDMLLIRAMRDSNLPKFLVDDAILFMALVKDLFPAVEIVDALNPYLERAITEDLKANHYEAHGPYVEKILQLQETMVVRHGVMVVGQTMCGKTVCSDTLRGALLRLHDHPENAGPGHAYYQPTTNYTMNPKAVSMGELYGEVNDVTQEWNDGILSNIARVAVRGEGSGRCWITFDGPVDALWIENMNTVLDDNKMLCLVNGERIKIPEHVTFCFEVQDLRVASPATVSRCGMVLIEPYQLDKGWGLLARRTNRLMAAKYPDRWFPERCNELLNNFVNAVLEFLRLHTKEYVATVDAQLVESLLILLESFIKNLDEDDDEPKELEPEKPPEPPKTEEEDDDPNKPAAAAAPEPEPEPEPEEEPEQEPRPHLPQVEMNYRRVFEMYFVLCAVWGLGGNVIGTDRQKLNPVFRKLISTVFPDFPSRGSVYDYCVHKKSMRFVPWTYKIDRFRFQRKTPYFAILVPTTETTIFSTFLRHLMAVQRHVLVNGPTGVGKSQVIGSFLLGGLRADRPDSPYGAFDISFSAQTSSRNLQERMESKLSKKRGVTVLGAPPGKHLVFFVDDLNMPALEEYGASPPIELLRQVIDQGGLYDRKKIFYKQILDLIVIAACGPPGGGKSEVTPRLTSKFSPFCFPTLGQESLLRIFRTIIRGFLAIFPKDVRALATTVVDATVEVYDLLFAEMRPTPSRSHYTFNMRDLSKVFQGILMVRPADVQAPQMLVKLWLHECSRVFHDRLIDDKDRTWWWGTSEKLLRKHFQLTWDAGYRTLLFCDFVDKPADGPSIYREAPPMEKVQEQMLEYMMSYNVNFNKEDDLVFFKDAVHHLSRICRVLRQPRGNALLVGVGGSGRQSLVRMAAFMAEQRCLQIAVTRGYGVAEFREDLKKALLDAGCIDRPLVFLLNDTQIAKEQFLEDINNVLNTGEVPNLIQSEDMERIMSNVSLKVKALGRQETRDVILAHFVYLVRENLHIVLCMSPIGDMFRTRLRMFPSLVNCMTIDWFDKWPKEALLSVAQRFFGKVEFPSDAVRASVCEMCMLMHQTVSDASTAFFQELRRRNYTTPTSYLELINSYIVMLAEQNASIDMQVSRFKAGLDKLRDTQVMVDDMKKQLAKMQPVLEQSAKDTAAMMKALEKDQKEAAATKKVVQVEEKETQGIMDEASEIRAMCQGDLDKAMPAFYSAMDALKSLNKKDIDEVKSFATPPEKVKLTLDAVLLLLKEKPGWDTAKKVMTDTQFLTRLQNYDKDNIPVKIQRQLQEWINNEDFVPEVIKATSNACMSLCLWVRAIDNYAKVTKDLGPKKAKLADAEEKLRVATEKLNGKREELAAVVAKVDKLQRSFDESVRKSEKLKAEMQLTETRLVRAGKLIGGLSSEKGAWERQSAQLAVSKGNLIGNMLLAAGAVAYLGPFTSKYRASLLETWTERCVGLRIPVDDTFTLASLTEPVTVRDWGIKGLPLDAVSIDNGTICCRARRWPLMVDPQGQANAWIRNLERANDLKVVKLNDSTLLRTLENCIRVGTPVLLENVGEALDPALDPVLQKQVYKSAGRLLLKLGDTEVDYDPAFKFYITTKLPNPHFMPELQIRTAIINFTVTPKGLEDQLLVDVVRVEREELEVQRDTLVVQIASGQAQLKALQDRILSLLAAADKNILDDEVLINTLAESKETSETINKDLKVAETTSKTIDDTREGYRSVATRGSLVYSVVASLGNLEHMYQLSLQFYKTLFNRTLTSTPPSEDVPTRIASLIAGITRDSYEVICRGLFEKDKLLYAFLMAVELEKYTGEVAPASWDFFLRGSGMKPDGSIPPPWMPTQVWTEVKALTSTIAGLEGLQPSILSHSQQWQTWYEADQPQDMPLPGNLQLTPWLQLVVLNTLRPEKLLFCVAQMVTAYLGTSFAESPPFDLEGSFKDSTPYTPLIFVLSSGSDPTVLFLTFAEERGFGERKQLLSLGQDQGPKAEAMIKHAIAEGEWVYLQNCHLCASWMPGLEKTLEDLSTQTLHEEYRLWLTTMPAPTFPVMVLQAGLKIVKEPPKGMRANLRDTIAGVLNDSIWEGCSKPQAWKPLVFSLVFFHGLIQERRKFGPLGWNVRYEWNNSDLATALKYLQTYLEDFEDIPWPAVHYILGVIVYGGRVTDFLDLRCVGCMLQMYLRQDSLDPACKFTPDGIYYPPAPGPLTGIFEYLSTLPQYEGPEVFGLHENADLTVQQAESQGMRDSILAVLGGGAAGGGSQDQLVDALANELLGKAPEPIDRKKAHPSIFKATAAGVIPSLSTVLVQEFDRFNYLLARIRSTLMELRRAIAGEVILSSDLEKMYNDFVFGRVPALWEKVGYPSLKPLGSWYADFIARMDFLREWLAGGNPKSYWISGFFFPQGFMTGVLQTHSRRFIIPIDEIGYATHVTEFEDPASLSSGPDVGVYIHGLYLEGARWDRKTKSLAESHKAELYDPMPVVWLECRKKADPQDGADELYAAPLYKISTRAGVLSTTGLSTNHIMNLELPTRSVAPDHWILRGAALLSMLNT